MPYKDPLKEIEKGKRFRASHPEYSRRYRLNNPDRIKVLQAAWRSANPVKLSISNFKANLKSKYGVSVEDYNSLLRKQNFKCAICRRDFEAQNIWVNTGKLAKGIKPDHCHNAGHLRGLLCHQCNMGIGNFKNLASLALKAAKYLEREVLFNGQ